MPRNLFARSRPRAKFRLASPPRYHRNGSAGDGFMAVAFDWRDGKAWRRLQAVLVPADYDDWPRNLVFVVDPADRDACFNGPYFADWLIARCMETSDDCRGDAYRTTAEIAAGTPPIARLDSPGDRGPTLPEPPA